MAFKFVIGEKGRAWKAEMESEGLVGKSLGDKVLGSEIKLELEGYEFEITGGSDISGLPLSKDAAGIGLKRILLSKGWGMRDSRAGVRMRKSVRGKTISNTTVQINMKVLKEGSKSLSEVFPEQNQPKAKEKKAEAVKTQ